MEVSALRYQGGIGLHGRTPLLRLQSDERLIALVRRGSGGAFEVLVSRYHSRLLAFCRHLLGSKEDAEDVLQEVFAAAYNAIVADDRPINVRPWLYRIARNRSLNHLRRAQAIGVDSMDIHFSEHGATTADKVHDREQFRMLVGDIHALPETQRTALVLREMDALSYEQIAEAMDTTVPGVKSLLVRARISLAESAEARQLSCDEVRIELAEVAEGLAKRPSSLVRRHLRACNRCETFQTQLKQTNKALAALLPIGPLALLRQLLIVHVGHSAGTGTGATAGAAGATSATTGAGASGIATGAGASGIATGAGAAGQVAALAGTATSGAALGSAGSLVSAGAGALASKAAAGLAAAALVTGAAVEASPSGPQHHALRAAAPPSSEVANSGGAALPMKPTIVVHSVIKHHTAAKAKHVASKPATSAATAKTPAAKAAPASTAAAKPGAKHRAKDPTATTPADTATTPAGRTQTQTDPTVLSSSAAATPGSATDTSGATPTSSSGTPSSGCSSTTATSPSTSSAQGTSTSTTTTTTPPTSTTTSTTPAATTPSGGAAPSTSPSPTTGTSSSCTPAASPSPAAPGS